MAASKGTQVNRTLPQQGQSPLGAFAGGFAQLQRGALTLWDGAHWAESRQVLTLDAPRGLGRRSDAALLALEAPPALAGDARLHILPAQAAPSQNVQGFISNSDVLSFIGPGHSAEEFMIASLNTRYRLELYKIYGPHDVRIQDSIALERRDFSTLVSLGSGVAACVRENQLLKLSFPAAQANYALPAGLDAIVHLSAAGQGELLWASSEHALQLLVLAQPVQVRQTIKPGLGLIFHIAADAGLVAALLLQESTEAAQRTWTLVVYEQSGAERWRVPVPDGPPEDRWVSLSPSAVAVGGQASLLAFDARTGQRLR